MTEGTQQISVLLVDDEENILHSLRRLLVDESYNVETASTGEEGLAKLRNLPNVGLIVSDQRMPGMNGAEFLEHTKELSPNALRILLTGYSDINATIDAINRGGAYRYISKPWNDEDLVQTIRDAVSQYELLLENRRLNDIIQQQNKELMEWNQNLKGRVLEQTTAIRKKNEELQSALERLREDYQGIITALSSLLEMLGKQEQTHARRVMELVTIAAKELGIAGDELETIRVAALLHDIGKIGLPERVLFRSIATLSQEDQNLYAKHSIRGQMAIVNIRGLQSAGVLIRHHHEHYDGNGFPDMLKGDKIPFGARLIAYADFLEHSARTAGGGDIAETVMNRAEILSGSRLDPYLTRLFRKASKYVFFSQTTGLKDISATIEVELKPKELHPGMVLSRSLISGTGILLLHDGTLLDDSLIHSIQSYFEMDPPREGIFVTTRRNI